MTHDPRREARMESGCSPMTGWQLQQNIAQGLQYNLIFKYFLSGMVSMYYFGWTKKYFSSLTPFFLTVIIIPANFLKIVIARSYRLADDGDQPRWCACQRTKIDRKQPRDGAFFVLQAVSANWSSWPWHHGLFLYMTGEKAEHHKASVWFCSSMHLL